jgi:hypothetical protein
MFENKGHFLNFKSTVECLETPTGWPKISADTLQVGRTPKLFLASIIAPVGFNSEDFESIRTIIQNYTSPGDITKYKKILIYSGMDVQDELIEAQHMFFPNGKSTKILLFAEEADHLILEKAIEMILDKLKKFDHSPLPPRPNDWDLSNFSLF